MTFYHIIDNALNEEQIQEIKNFKWENAVIEKLFRPKNSQCVQPIIDIAAQYYDLSSLKYNEIWEQNNTRPSNWHFDKDELLAEAFDIEVFPLCSTIYYLEVGDDLVDGKLFIRDPETTEKHYIEPKTNRLVVFGPGVYHYVQEFTGRRHSFLCNPWSRIIGKFN